MRPLNIVLNAPPNRSDGPQHYRAGVTVDMDDPKATPWEIGEEDFPHAGSTTDRLRYLLRYAVLAPSSHNSQPWKFSVDRNVIALFADTSRWLKVADPDRRELYISLGCALENLLVAAGHFGFDYQVSYFPVSEDRDLAAKVELFGGGASGSPRASLFPALTARRTNRKSYDRRPLSEADRGRLIECCNEEGISLYLTDDPEIRGRVNELTVRADEVEFADPAFRRELSYWLGHRAFGTSWLTSQVQAWTVAHINVGKSIARKDSELLRSAPVWGLVCSKEDDRLSRIRVGQTFERICLTASLLGLGIQPMSQVLEVPEIKEEIRKLIPGKDLFPQQPFRLGYAEPETRHTPRRTPEEVLVRCDLSRLIEASDRPKESAGE